MFHYRQIWLLILAAMLLSTTAESLLACSSCGSGGADPVVLNPNETSKLYLGLSQQSEFHEIDIHGDRQKSYGPQFKRSLDLAVAQRLLPRIFASAVFNAGENSYPGTREVQNGDVSVNVRGTLLQQNMAEIWLPQLQILGGHRFATGRSVHEQKQEHFLDVFGAGYDETYLGADLWFGMTPIMAGGSVLFGFPQAEATDDGSLQAGRLQRFIGTVGGLAMTELKLIGGFIHEQRGGSTLDGAPQGDSDKLDHDLFITTETLYSEGSNYRLSINRKAAFGRNKNATEATVVTLAWMRTL